MKSNQQTFAAPFGLEALKQHSIASATQPSHQVSQAQKSKVDSSQWVQQFASQNVNTQVYNPASQVESKPQPRTQQPAPMLHPSNFMRPYVPLPVMHHHHQHAHHNMNTSTSLTSPAMDMSSVKRMVETLKSTGRFGESKFVEMVDRMTKGELQLSDQSVVDKDGMELNLEDMFVTPDHHHQHSQDTTQSPDFTKEELDSQMSRSMDEYWREWVKEESNQSSNFAPTSLPQEPFKYSFATTNPHLHSDPESNLESARNFLSQNNVHDAILAAEAAARLTDSADSWKFLGDLHAWRDSDQLATGCFQKALTADPYCGAETSLAVSLANEGNTWEACKSLFSLIDHSEMTNAQPQHRSMKIGDYYIDLENMKSDLQAQLTGLGQISRDPEILMALGVAQTLNGDLPNATTSFKQALGIFYKETLTAPSSSNKLTEVSLLNKLGATLANSGDANTALKCYSKALEISSLPRIWSNAAVALQSANEPVLAILAFTQGLQLLQNPSSLEISNDSGLWSAMFSCLARMANDDAPDAPYVTGDRTTDGNSPDGTGDDTRSHQADPAGHSTLSPGDLEILGNLVGQRDVRGLSENLQKMGKHPKQISTFFKDLAAKTDIHDIIGAPHELGFRV